MAFKAPKPLTEAEKKAAKERRKRLVKPSGKAAVKAKAARPPSDSEMVAGYIYNPRHNPPKRTVLPPIKTGPGTGWTMTQDGPVPRPAAPPVRPTKSEPARVGQVKGIAPKPPVITVAPGFNPEDIHIAWRPYQLRFINDPCTRRLWVKSAQIGGSTTLASWALARCLNRPNHLVTMVSASQPQSDELALKSRRFVKEIAGVEARWEEGFFQKTELLERSLKFPNGSRIVALSSNPDTLRSYTGDIILDEFGMHQNPAEVFTAAYRQVTLGDFCMLIASTPNGQQGRFYQMAHELGLDLGHSPAVQPTRVGTWSGHWTDIYLAVQEGLRLEKGIEEIRAGCDAMTWAQEYCCSFLSESELWITPDMVDAAVSLESIIGPPPLYKSNLFAGWDIARSQNKSVIWFSEIMGDVSMCRGLVNLVGLSTPVQIAQARQWMGQIQRMNIDKTGMGLVIAETLELEYPQKAAGVLFTSATKEAMAVQMRLRLEQRKVRIPNDDGVRRSFLSLRRSVNKLGQARFDAENDEKYGHADEWWAACMAEMAAEREVGVGAQSQIGRSGIMFPGSNAPGGSSAFAGFTKKVL